MTIECIFVCIRSNRNKTKQALALVECNTSTERVNSTNGDVDVFIPCGRSGDDCDDTSCDEKWSTSGESVVVVESTDAVSFPSLECGEDDEDVDAVGIGGDVVMVRMGHWINVDGERRCERNPIQSKLVLYYRRKRVSYGTLVLIYSVCRYIMFLTLTLLGVP